MNQNEEIKEEEIPEELYAPLGNLTFKKPTNESKNEQNDNSKEIEPEVLSYNDVKLEYAEKPFDTKKLIIRIFVFIVILLFLLALFLYQKNNKNILRIGINNLSNSIENSIYGIKKSAFLSFNLNKPFRTSVLLSFDATYDETKLKKEQIEFYKILNDISMSETLDIDYKNKQFTHSTEASYIGGNIINIYGNATDKGITYKIKDVIGKYIYYPIDNFKRIYIDSNSDKKDFDEIKSIVLKTLFLNIEEEDMYRKKEKIKLGNHNIKVKDVSLSMTNEYIIEILTKTVDDLKNNDEFVDKTMNYTNLASTRLKELMDELKKEIKETKFVKETITLHIYSKGITNKIIGYKVSANNEKDTIEYLEYKNDLLLSVRKDNKDYFSYKQDKNNSKKYYYTIKYLDNILTMNRIEEEENILFEYSINEEKTKKYSGTIIVIDSTSKNKKSGSIKLALTELDNNNEKVVNLSGTLNYDVKLLEKISLYDDENMVEYDTLTEDDKKEIKRRIENLENFKFVKEKYEAFLNLSKKEK